LIVFDQRAPSYISQLTACRCHVTISESNGLYYEFILILIFPKLLGRCESPKFGCTSYLKKPLKFGSESALYTSVTIALQ